MNEMIIDVFAINQYDYTNKNNVRKYGTIVYGTIFDESFESWVNNTMASDFFIKKIVDLSLFDSLPCKAILKYNALPNQNPIYTDLIPID